MKPSAIHQFSISCHYGDGITNGMFFIRKLLRSAGFSSEIFCEHIDQQLAGDILPHEFYSGASDHVLLIHHGIGNGVEDWLRCLPDKKIMVFHNITPAEFFPADDPIQPLLERGWQQVESWKDWLDGTIADSDTNLEILARHGYDSHRCMTIPLLVDLDELYARNSTPSPRPVEDIFHLLFVGRLVPHKNQSGLIQMLVHLRRMTGLDVHLTLVGSGDNTYRAELEQTAVELGLSSCVHLTGKISDAELADYFGRSDLYVSLSRHEGFGMPLIEAMAHCLPIVAFDSPESNVAKTLGGAGIILGSDQPVFVAGVLASAIEQPLLRRELVKRGLEEIERFSPGILFEKLAAFFLSLGIEIPATGFEGKAEHLSDYRIEGPFDSTYSLAIVNRNLALALASSGHSVALHATEGYGDYTPDNKFLAAHPQLQELYRSSQGFSGARTVLRLMYPTRLSGMNGMNHALSCYGWEESSIPDLTIEHINYHAHFVTTMSDYVTRTLIDNGVSTPIFTVGIGADHILECEPNAAELPNLGSGFRILHVSSCFPRKGIDCLLEAYGSQFTAKDDVTLIIKTFPNPHHDIASSIRNWRLKYPSGAGIVVINRDVSDSAIRALYQNCHLLVAPSRGEGFGLPMAEAMLHKLPVVTTGYGGQTDFCNNKTAWLIDYNLEYAQTHMGISDSVWAEPDTEHLGIILLELFTAFTSGLWVQTTRDKVDAAFDLVTTKYTWNRVSARHQQIVESLDRIPIVRQKVNLGCITSWNSKCGIASYSKLLLTPALSTALIFANTNAELIAEDGANVRRCWEPGQTDNLDDLFECVLASGVDQVLIQFNFSFFRLDALKKLLSRLAASRIDVFITFHSTADVVEGPEYKTLAQLLPELHQIARIFVHSIADLANLKDLGLATNTAVFPHGVTGYSARPTDELLPTGMEGKRVIASYGFLLPHKGIQNLIRAFSTVAATYPDAHLLLVNAEYPAYVSTQEADTCRRLIEELRLNHRVSLITEYLTDNESLAWLSLSDYIVFPYHHTQESSSAAVRWGLSTGKPVYCTPLPIFDDVKDVVQFFPGTGLDSIEVGLSSILANPPSTARLQELSDRQRQWLSDHEWRRLSVRLKNLFISWKYGKDQ
jgi:glycosyltransferase involved in cell wall biosynthesis